MIKLTDDLKKLTLNDFRDAAFNHIIEIFKNDKSIVTRRKYKRS